MADAPLVAWAWKTPPLRRRVGGEADPACRSQSRFDQGAALPCQGTPLPFLVPVRLMLQTAEVESFLVRSLPDVDPGAELARCGAALRKAFGVAFSFWDAQTSELLHASTQQPAGNDLLRGQLARAVHGSEPQFLADEDCLLLIAVPLDLEEGQSVVATSLFVTRVPSADEM